MSDRRSARTRLFGFFIGVIYAFGVAVILTLVANMWAEYLINLRHLDREAAGWLQFGVGIEVWLCVFPVCLLVFSGYMPFAVSYFRRWTAILQSFTILLLLSAMLIFFLTVGGGQGTGAAVEELLGDFVEALIEVGPPLVLVGALAIIVFARLASDF